MFKTKNVVAAKKDSPARSWLCTLNNPGDCSLAKIHELTGAVFTVGQLEKGENGTLHLQFFQNFKGPVRLSHYKKVLPAAHCEAAIGDKAREYCMKEDTRVEGPWEFGVKPVQRNSKADWEEVYLKAKRGRIEEIPADIRVRCYSQLKRIEKDHLEVKDAEDLRGVWIYGPSGVGKSWTARQKFPGAYPKLCNKWWDGYQGQANVIMDDIGLDHKCLGQQLKIWADRYGCILETKGGALGSAYKNFVVTSQYSIEEIWAGDEKTIEALRRRFKVTHIPWKIFSGPKAADPVLAEAAKDDPFVIDSFAIDREPLEDLRSRTSTDTEYLALLEP